MRPFGDYLGRFPGLELEVAREYLAYLERRTGADRRDGPAPSERYRPGAPLGRGGMGEVCRAYDGELRRSLAMKTLARPGARARARFLREASITARLDHPGIPPVHDLGVDSAGRPFFVMKLVEGQDLDEVFARVARGDGEWTLARALEAMIKVCDTLAFAHSRNVVHRDLKPANVRVGRFGEVYVMDWGLARASEESEPVEGPGAADGDEWLTLDGDVLGTPAYMSPEQAEGRRDAVGEASDVYAIGAMLYHLLAGRRPYDAGTGGRRSQEVLELVRTRPPESLVSLAGRQPAELVAIVERAMQRDPSKRYATVEALGRDLRAHLEQRWVSAYRASRLEQAAKWVRRNRSVVLPAVSVAAMLFLAMLVLRRQQREGRERLLQLSRSQLVTAFDTLWPPHPGNLPALERWTEEASAVIATRDEDLRAIEELKRRALPMDPEAPAERAERARLAERVRLREALVRHYETLLADIDGGKRAPPEGRSRAWIAVQVDVNRAELERDRAAVVPHLTFRFADPEDRILFEALNALTAEQLRILGSDRSFGLLDLARWGLSASRGIDDLSRGDGRAWAEARRSIADPAECPRYSGLELATQQGLVPIGRDPESGLWEFAHVLSGAVPSRAADGTLVIDADSAIVLVLVPGGALERGSQSRDPGQVGYDPWTEPDEQGGGRIELEPFFLSKYELTQAQWRRVTGRNHCETAEAGAVGPLYPLYNVDFEDARRFLRVLGLVLPTEAQWEWAQRAGSDTPWSCGSRPEDIAGHANLADRWAAGHVFESEAALLPELEDGFAMQSPVGSFRANAFGLHDVMGNVREWCRDVGPFAYRHGFTHIMTGERVPQDEGLRAARGGGFAQSVLRCRSAARDRVGPLMRQGDLGIRPARELDR